VNGFLIDAVEHGIGLRSLAEERYDVTLTFYNFVVIWLRLSSAPKRLASSMGEAGCRLMQAASGFVPGLSLMVWILKREVRAFGGCLGMYRR
jgi:hypothetical protein